MQLARGFSNYFQGPHDIRGEKEKLVANKGKGEPTSCILTVGGMLLYEAYRKKREEDLPASSDSKH